ncbi:MAG: 6-bladed beta-propeller [Candidatus Aminicenantes bacterium]
MRKFFVLFPILFLLSCGQKGKEAEIVMEEGVPVVVNRIEPYEIKGECTNLRLEEIFRIDTENEEMAEIGLTDLWRFDADSGGDIYLMGYTIREYSIFKFDRTGNFVTSFGRRGQGPGEVQRPTFIRVSGEDRIYVLDAGNTKLIIYGNDGELITEIPANPSLVEITPLNSEKYLIKKRRLPEDETSEFIAEDNLIISGLDFQEGSVLEAEKIPNISTVTRFRPMFSVFYSVSEKKIFIGNSEKGYEISIHDSHGNVLRKLRKQYQPVGVPGDFKERVEKLLARMGRTISFPEFLPPFQYLFTDDQGRLFVMTYEKGSRTRGYTYDVFNPEGFFAARIQLDNYGFLEYFGGEGPLDARAKSGRLYCIREKENGYKELIVYRMIWESED